MSNKRGFTVIELLIVVILIGMVLSVGLPVSYGMYASYNASLSTQEVMAYVSEIRRDAFLHSERKVLSSKNGVMVVDGLKKEFRGLHVQLSDHIVFYRNGTSSGGIMVLTLGDVVHHLVIKAPLGDLSLERRGA